MRGCNRTQFTQPAPSSGSESKRSRWPLTDPGSAATQPTRSVLGVARRTNPPIGRCRPGTRVSTPRSVALRCLRAWPSSHARVRRCAVASSLRTQSRRPKRGGPFGQTEPSQSPPGTTEARFGPTAQVTRFCVRLLRQFRLRRRISIRSAESGGMLPCGPSVPGGGARNRDPNRTTPGQGVGFGTKFAHRLPYWLPSPHKESTWSNMFWG